MYERGMHQYIRDRVEHNRMPSLLASTLLILSTPLFVGPVVHTASAQALPEISVPHTTGILIQPTALRTESSLTETIEEEIEDLPFKTIVTEDPEQDISIREVTQEGKVGTRLTRYTLTSWEGELIDREIKEVIEEPPQDELVTQGTKITPKSLDTEEGTLTYSKTMRVWSTSYDGNCAGCTGRTYTGKSVTHGICAVDPSVIPLGSKFYVPGYGLCSAEDIGGGVKGDKIDVGFHDVREGWWSARYVDIYLLL